MHDDWAGVGAAFDGKDAGDGFGVEGVSAKTIDGFGGESD